VCRFGKRRVKRTRSAVFWKSGCPTADDVLLIRPTLANAAAATGISWMAVYSGWARCDGSTVPCPLRRQSLPSAPFIIAARLLAIMIVRGDEPRFLSAGLLFARAKVDLAAPVLVRLTACSRGEGNTIGGSEMNTGVFCRLAAATDSPSTQS
jgi:hypothetical protein